LVALRSLSLKPTSFGYKTPPIRFSQAGGQSAHKARPPNLELALTPLAERPNNNQFSNHFEKNVKTIYYMQLPFFGHEPSTVDDGLSWPSRVALRDLSTVGTASCGVSALRG